DYYCASWDSSATALF
nr:immunoglobulin light chain junction region [Macaca mulatta]MOW14930.1 immunoglobulin light chain junction region [Macaca mulatta]MOW15220.1 immunoglobulin light chain junction region [Macaca mulatta]MOW15822.1 immunoglobulin light chain junction region [Macaca mulatta]MOW15847.1 immunoglobulin light chain junction region [Macaca mulatta]